MESLDSFEKLLIVMLLTVLIVGSMVGFGCYIVL